MANDRGSGLATEVKTHLPGLRAFIRRRIADSNAAEDLLQDVLAEYVAAYRLLQPIERAGAWLLRVAHNRIIDRYRANARARRVLVSGRSTADEERRLLDELLAPASDEPEAAYDRQRLLDDLEAAIASLPEPQRAVFIAHELEGRSFRELAEACGESINTLLGRKHSAVQALRARLQARRIEFNL